MIWTKRTRTLILQDFVQAYKLYDTLVIGSLTIRCRTFAAKMCGCKIVLAPVYSTLYLSSSWSGFCLKHTCQRTIFKYCDVSSISSDVIGTSRMLCGDLPSEKARSKMSISRFSSSLQRNRVANKYADVIN